MTKRDRLNRMIGIAAYGRNSRMSDLMYQVAYDYKKAGRFGRAEKLAMASILASYGKESPVFKKLNVFKELEELEVVK